jgi:PAS domain S-box-containing protein
MVTEKIKILYIDSNKSYGQKFLTYLIDNNYSIKYINSIKEALIEYSYNVPDIIISDILLEDGNGLNYITKIKENNKNIKTIILTEKANNEDLLKAISIKIDKIIFKNLSFDEINKEIKELKQPIKKDLTINNSLFDLGENYYYDISKLNLMKENQIISLTKQESELLNELIKVKGNIVSFSIIQKKIAKDNETTLDTVRTVVRKIRKKTYPDLIKNYSGIGYAINISNKLLSQNKYKINTSNKNNAKILIIKGDKERNKLITIKLQKFGFECDNVYTLYEAKELLNEKKYDFIILELNLPDGDAIDYIRNHEDTIETKIIVLSSDIDIYYKDYLYFKGIVDYIVEGKDIDYLVYNIHKTISKITSNYYDNNNILVIEQSKRICEQIKDLLQPRNYNISVMNDISQAYKLIQTKLFSLIILDISYQNCFDFMLEIKSNLDKNIPFIILTNTNRSHDEVKEAYLNGAKDCLKKPLFAEEFILKVDQIIEHENLLSKIIKQQELMSSYQKIVDRTTIVSKTDINGIITYANKKFCEVSGYKENELIGQSHNIIKHPGNPQSLFEKIWKMIKIDKKIWTGIIKNRKKDGTTYIVQTYIMPILDNTGEIIEYIALRNDITNIYQNDKIIKKCEQY